MDYNTPVNILIDTSCRIESFICSTQRTAKITADVYNSARQLPPAWDLLLPVGSKLASHILMLIEDSAIEGLTYYYIIVKNEDKPIGLVYFQRLALTKQHYPDFSGAGTIAKHVYNYAAGKAFGLLTAGNLFYTGFPWYWFDDKAIKADDFFRTVNKAATLLLKTSRSHMVMLKDVDDKLNNYISRKPSGYAHMGEDIFMQMPLNLAWQTFDDYAKALSKKYAARVRKMKEAVAGVRVKKLNLEQAEALAPQIDKLYLEVIGHSSVKIGILNAQYFINMKKALGANFDIWGWFEGDRMVAFTSTLVENGSYEVYYIGYGDDDNKRLCLYPNILLHGVEQAIADKKKVLKLGRTALEAKAIVGAGPIYLNNYIKMKGKLLQLGFGFILKVFGKERGNDWKKRNPFKK